MMPLSRRCLISKESFSISEKEQEYCEKYSIPLPVLSPRERLRQLAVFRNRSTLYQGTCALTKKRILTQYSPTTVQPIYEVSQWMSDAWDPKSYGRSYDFSKPFFRQMLELYHAVPLPSLAVVMQGLENSDYTNGITCAKNCYLLFGASFNEDCHFSRMINNSRSVLDCLLVNNGELCYECFNVHDSYNLRFSENCHNCSDSSFLFGCQGCKHCYGCINLRNVEYYFYNEQLSRSEYERRIREIDLGSYAVLQRERAQFEASLHRAPIKYYSGKNNENSSGNFLNNTKNCANSFFCSQCEDVENSIWMTKAKDCFSTCCFGNNSELIYNSVTVGDESYNIRFSADCWPSARDLEYCIYMCLGSSDCFACVGMKRAQYCIFNKQYTKSEYQDLVPRIIAHMRSTGEYGRFFPAAFAPFAYNVSEAHDFLPLAKAEAISYGYLWEEEPVLEAKTASKLPDNIKDVTDSILDGTCICKESHKPYRIVKQELKFYRENNLPLPRIAPIARLSLKRKLLAVHSLCTVPCVQCGKNVESMYDEKARTIYCEECFQKLVA